MAGTSRTKESTAPPFRSKSPVICRYAWVGSTGKALPARISGVAKSASEAANRSRKALASPGTVRGSVTVRKTRQRELPRLKAMSSTFGSMPFRIGFNVR